MMDGIGQSRPFDAPSTDHAPVQGFPIYEVVSLNLGFRRKGR